MSNFTLEDWKILGMVLFPFVATTGIALSVWLGRSRRPSKQLWFACCVMFSSGILVSASLVHTLPRATEIFVSLQQQQQHQSTTTSSATTKPVTYYYPWANVIFGSFFLLLLSIEVLAEHAVHRYVQSRGGQVRGLVVGHDHGGDVVDKHDRRGMDRQVSKATTATATTSSSGGFVVEMAVDGQQQKRQQQLGSVQERTPARRNGDDCGDEELGISGEIANVSSGTTSGKKRDDGGLCIVKVGKQHEQPNASVPVIAPWVAILLLVVLSIHIFLEGMTLGASPNLAAFETSFTAIIAHKLFANIALGSSFMSAGYWDEPRMRRLFLMLMTAWILLDPLAIGIGWAMSTSSGVGGDSYATAILFSMLGGSFLFVAVVELIPGELKKTKAHKYPVLVVLGCLLVGFALMSLLAHWV